MRSETKNKSKYFDLCLKTQDAKENKERSNSNEIIENIKENSSKYISLLQ